MKVIKEVTVEKVTYFCDICNKDITHERRNTCPVCGRLHCMHCHKSTRAERDILIGICPICEKTARKFQIHMKMCEEVYKRGIENVYSEWKKESLLVENKTEQK